MAKLYQNLSLTGLLKERNNTREVVLGEEQFARKINKKPKRTKRIITLTDAYLEIYYFAIN